MICIVDVYVQAANPDFQLRPWKAFSGSPTSVRVRNLPSKVGAWEITAVHVVAVYPDNTTKTADCVLTDGVWVGTVEASASVGSVINGYSILADGVDENGATVTGYRLGRGDVYILDVGVTAMAGVPSVFVHILDAEPDTPHKGDLVKFGSTWKVYNGASWDALGGGGGSGAVESVNGKTGAVVLDAAAVGARPASWTPTASDVGALSTRGGTVHGGIDMYGQTGATGLQVGAGGYGGYVEVYSGSDSPASIKKDGKEVATEDQLRVTMQLVGNDPYTIQLNGVVQTFDQVKTLAETRNAVIQRGQGTYRVTYIGATEMMWDVTGAVAGNVQTGQVHIFDQDGQTVVQRVAPKVLATEPMVDAVSAMAAYPIETIVGGAVKDRTVNVCEGGGVITFPGMRVDGCVRDFVVRVPAMETAPTVVFPSYVRYESWQDAGDIWTAEAGKANEWYFSESEPGVFKVVHQALGVVTQ